MIRFKKDDGSNYPEWEDKKMKDVITLLRGSSPRPIVNYATSDGSGVNWIKIGDMPKTGSLVTSVSEKITEEGAKKSRKVNIGDLILSNSMSFGKPYILGIEGYIHDGWFVIRDYEENFNRDYLCQLLASETVQHQYNSLSAGGVVQNISSDIVNSVKIKLPCLEEQQKIADFLSSVDDVITASEQEVTALEEQKKGVMQKIFSQEVRFKADEGSDYPEWKSATFGDVFTMLQNNSFSRDQLSEDSGQIQNIHYGDVLVKFGSIIDCENDALPFINEDISTDKFNEESYIQNGDIIVADTAEDYTAGKVAEVQNVGERKILSGLHTMLCRPQKEFASCYLGHYLNSEQFHKQIVRLLVGTKVYSINKKVIVDTVLNFPCLEEQKKIANLLSDMDTSIDLAKQELEQWKELKKGLLQQLFE